MKKLLQNISVILTLVIALLGIIYESRQQGQVAGDYSQAYAVTEIVDGDTIKIDYQGEEETIRLIGIDTPESAHPNKGVECFGKEATNYMQLLVGGKFITLELDETQDLRDRYGRLLAYVWTGDLLVNEEMLRQGYAFEYTYNYPYKYQQQFKDAQNQARANNLGLWGSCPL